MNQADMRSAVNGTKPDAIESELQQMQPNNPPIDPFSQPDLNSGAFKQPHEQMQTLPAFQDRSPEVEELVESIIEEKWDELVKDINKIVDWKNEAETRISSLQQEFSTLKDDFDKLHQAVIGKIGEYDKNILMVGAEVKAMEKVFSKVLPVFTEKVNELADVADSMKKNK